MTKAVIKTKTVTATAGTVAPLVVTSIVVNSNRTVTVSGSGQPLAVVKVYAGKTLVATTVIPAAVLQARALSVLFKTVTSPLTPGPHNLTVMQVVGGATSTASVLPSMGAVVVDTATQGPTTTANAPILGTQTAPGPPGSQTAAFSTTIAIPPRTTTSITTATPSSTTEITTSTRTSSTSITRSTTCLPSSFGDSWPLIVAQSNAFIAYAGFSSTAMDPTNSFVYIGGNYAENGSFAGSPLVGKPNYLLPLIAKLDVTTGQAAWMTTPYGLQNMTFIGSSGVSSIALSPTGGLWVSGIFGTQPMNLPGVTPLPGTAMPNSYGNFYPFIGKVDTSTGNFTMAIEIQVANTNGDSRQIIPDSQGSAIAFGYCKLNPTDVFEDG